MRQSPVCTSMSDVLPNKLRQIIRSKRANNARKGSGVQNS